MMSVSSSDDLRAHDTEIMLKIAPRVTASFHDAGHILGSAAIRVKYTARGNTTTVLFSGDLGRSNMPILRDPEPRRHATC